MNIEIKKINLKKRSLAELKNATFDRLTAILSGKWITTCDYMLKDI